MTQEELEQLLHDAIDYLDYIGWGDRWERECYASTQDKLLAFQTKYPRKEDT